MERMTAIVPDCEYQAIQQFISDSGWDYQQVMNRVAEVADELIGDENESCLLLDESGFRKKGTKSVGVARQWLGNIGKVDSGQVVFLLLYAKEPARHWLTGPFISPKNGLMIKDDALMQRYPWMIELF